MMSYYYLPAGHATCKTSFQTDRPVHAFKVSHAVVSQGEHSTTVVKWEANLNLQRVEWVFADEWGHVAFEEGADTFLFE